MYNTDYTVFLIKTRNTVYVTKHINVHNTEKMKHVIWCSSSLLNTYKVKRTVANAFYEVARWLMKGVCVCVHVSAYTQGQPTPITVSSFLTIYHIFVSHSIFFFSSISGPEISWLMSLKLPQSKSSAFWFLHFRFKRLCHLHFHTTLLVSINCYVYRVWRSGTVLLFRETPSWLWVAWLQPSLNMRATCLLIMTAASG